jgi:hypothetical protein
MAALTRVLQKIFGETGDTAEFGQVGSDSAGSPATTKNLDTIQSLSQYAAGLFAITSNLINPPRGEDFNALLYLITTQLKYLFQSGVPEWIATENYYANKSFVIGSNGNIYKSLTGTDGSPNINHNPVGDTTNWAIVWDKTNDGTGSGLDADLLDGQSGSYYQNAGNLNAGTIPSGRLSASDLLTLIKTVDGTGSGLDSDYVRGLGLAIGSEATVNVNTLANVVKGVTDANNITGNGVFFNTSTPTPSNFPTNNYYSGIQFYIAYNSTYKIQLVYASTGSTGNWYVRGQIGGSWGGWRKLWNAGNDGSGSGLDADLLDGQHGSYYAKVNTATSATATDLPVGSHVLVMKLEGSDVALNETATIRISTSNAKYFLYTTIPSSGTLSGTWRCSGSSEQGDIFLFRRVA